MQFGMTKMTDSPSICVGSGCTASAEGPPLLPNVKLSRNHAQSIAEVTGAICEVRDVLPRLSEGLLENAHSFKINAGNAPFFLRTRIVQVQSSSDDLGEPEEHPI